MMGITLSFEDLVLKWILNFLDEHKKRGIPKNLILPVIMIMPHKISDIFIGYEALQNMKIMIL